ELKEVSPTQKELKIEIDAATLKDAYGKVSQRYAKRANVPGFRRGYAPVDVVRMRFKEEIKSEVLQEVVPTAVAGAIEEHGLNPLAEPHLHLDDHDNIVVNGTQPLSLHAHVEVMAEIPVPKYENIEVTRRVRPLKSNEVDDLITERLKKEAALIPVEGRESRIGDTVVADLEGSFDDDSSAEPIKAEDLEVVLGDEAIERTFTDNLVGVKPDEEKEFTVTYSEDFSSEALAGKTVHYKAKIKSLSSTELPEANDEWAKSLDEGYDSLADLRKKLHADLETYAKADADARVRNSAVAKLIEDNSFEVPNTLIENQARNLLNNFAQEMQERGIDLNKIDENFVQMAYGNMRTQAERDVRGALLLDRVAEIEKVAVTDAEVDEELGKMAQYYRVTPEEVRETLSKQGGALENISNNLKTRKSIEAVIAKAKITDGEWVDESAPTVQSEQGDETAGETPKKPAKKAPAKKAAKAAKEA
ncbi:MAG: trigger factor, partial [Acidobacteriota bacterium]